jgi:hypothetical protein
MNSSAAAEKKKKKKKKKKIPPSSRESETDNRPKPEIAASYGSLYKLLLLPLLLLVSFAVAHFEKMGNNN